MERLKHYSEEELCDLLGITSEDIITRFSDIVEAKQEYLSSELEILSEEEENEQEELDGYQIEFWNDEDDD